MEENNAKKIYLLVTTSAEENVGVPTVINDVYATKELAISQAKGNYEGQKRLEGEHNILSHMEYDDGVLLFMPVISGKRLYTSVTVSQFNGKKYTTTRTVYEQTINTK